MFGTLSIGDLLDVRNQSVVDFGEDRIYAVFSEYLAAHNRILADQMADFVEDSTERMRGAGAIATMVVEDMDEFSTPDVQKTEALGNQGWPLRGHQGALQWTLHYMRKAKVFELAAQFQALVTADVRRTQRDIKRAIFTPTNSTFKDYLVDRASLPVKALANADSFPIDPSPNGDTFDSSTHSHYLATATLTAANVTSLIDTVREHYTAGEIRLYIPQGAEATIRGFDGANEFAPFLDARLIAPPGGTDIYARGQLARFNTYDRAIGVFGAAEVWVKPWIPTNYMLAWIRGPEKPIRRRIRDRAMSSFHLIFDDEQHPLRARGWEREQGFGVLNRTAAAVLYYGVSGTYAAPTIT